MNYSASENYWTDCEKFEKKRIIACEIKKRWFRNYYVLYQCKGWFTHDTFVLKYGDFNPHKYDGSFYGPFSKEVAEAFATLMKNTHENFILGG